MKQLFILLALVSISFGIKIETVHPKEITNVTIAQYRGKIALIDSCSKLLFSHKPKDRTGFALSPLDVSNFLYLKLNIQAEIKNDSVYINAEFEPDALLEKIQKWDIKKFSYITYNFNFALKSNIDSLFTIYKKSKKSSKVESQLIARIMLYELDETLSIKKLKKEIEQIRRRDTNSPFIYYKKAQLIQNMNPQKALATLNKGIYEDSLNINLYTFKASIYKRLQNSDSAQYYRQKAYNLNPNHFNNTIHLAALHEDVREYSKADELFLKLLELEPHWAILHNNRAVNFFKQQDFENAKILLDKALNIDPSSLTLINNKCLLLEHVGNYVEVFKEINSFIEQYPDKAFLYNTRGELYYQYKKWNKAWKDYNKAIELDPHYAKALCNRAIMQMTINGSKADAFFDINRAMKIDKKNPVPHYYKGELYSFLKQYKSALKELNKAISLNPNYYVAIEERANIYTIQKKFTEALRELNHLIEIDPKQIYAYVEKLKIYQEMGELEKADKEFAIAYDNASEVSKGRLQRMFPERTNEFH